jgi:UDP-3-O-[3-hydroxymyristoyl] glucosamine N-acyltransferase
VLAVSSLLDEVVIASDEVLGADVVLGANVVLGADVVLGGVAGEDGSDDMALTDIDRLEGALHTGP